MKLFFDANMPRAAQRVALARGHVAEHVRDIGLGDANDVHIAEHARATRAILVTRDTDFSDIRKISAVEFPGILVLRLPHNTTAAQLRAYSTDFSVQRNWSSKCLGVLPSRIPGGSVSDRFRSAGRVDWRSS